MSLGAPLALVVSARRPGGDRRRRACSSRRGRSADRVHEPRRARDGLGPRRRPRSRLVPAALLLLALVAAATAAARPQARLPVRVDNATIVLLVDVSGSMSARDVEPTRLDAAVSAMRGFVERLPAGFKVGLVQFSDDPEVLAAPTADHARISETLGLLVPDSGTALGAGLATRRPADERARSHATALSPQPGRQPARGDHPALRRQAEPGPDPAAPGSRARARGRDPRRYGRARDAARHPRLRAVRAARRSGASADAAHRQGDGRSHCDREGHEGSRRPSTAVSAAASATARRRATSAPGSRPRRRCCSPPPWRSAGALGSLS